MLFQTSVPLTVAPDPDEEPVPVDTLPLATFPRTGISMEMLSDIFPVS